MHVTGKYFCSGKMVYTPYSKKHRPKISGGSFVFLLCPIRCKAEPDSGNAINSTANRGFIYMQARDCIASPNSVGSAPYKIVA